MSNQRFMLSWERVGVEDDVMNNHSFKSVGGSTSNVDDPFGPVIPEYGSAMQHQQFQEQQQQQQHQRHEKQQQQEHQQQQQQQHIQSPTEQQQQQQQQQHQHKAELGHIQFGS